MKDLMTAAILLLIVCSTGYAQLTEVQDDFEGNGTITTWFGDNCNYNPAADNPYVDEVNPSAKVLEYDDVGGQFANVRFQIDETFDLSTGYVFKLKIYVPASGITGNQNNQISLKLQDGNLPEPWLTQSEIIKPLTLDQWQTVTFNFAQDNYINLDASSPPPTERTDFNRVVLQINGENNNDFVRAYLDDFSFEFEETGDPVYDYLVWSDEFEGEGAINSEKWFHQTQLPDGVNWFNGEIQHYTDRIENSFVQDGYLKLTARKETFTDQGQTKNHTSARLNSKFAFQYGRVEVRAKLPFGPGTWPAIWTLGKNINENGAYWDNQGFGTTSWPACGEMDIMEHWGTNQNYVSSATHTPSSFGSTVNTGGQFIETASTEFHVYELVWSPEKLVFSVDGANHFTYNPENKNSSTWPFTAEQYLILNVAILPSISSSFTQSAMEIDYVRVYQESPPVTSVEILESEEIKVYPNPFTNEIVIDTKEFSGEKLSVKMYTTDGRLIESRRFNSVDEKLNLRNLSGLKEGVYLLLMEGEKKTAVAKIIKE